MESLENRVSKLERAMTAFAGELRLAFRYIQSDAASSLTKSRIVMEKLLVALYTAEMGRAPRKPLLGELLADNQFTRKIERRILSRMNGIRDLANLGPHGEAVEPTDAAKVLDDLCEVLDWYLARRAADGTAPAGQDAPGATGGGRGRLNADEAERLQTANLLLTEFFRPVQMRLQRDSVNWRRILDLAEPEGSLRRRIAESVERDYLLPNHDEIVAIVERWRYLLVADEALTEVLNAYIHHVVIYKAIRASGDKTQFPEDVGAPWPKPFAPLIDERTRALEQEHAELQRRQRGPA